MNTAGPRPRTTLPGVAAAVLAAVAVIALAPRAGAAQEELEYRISQRATLTQKLGRTAVTVDYSRPLVRGRTELFGGVVHWGELWTPGANEATTLETDRALTLNGHDVAPGVWSMWIIPSEVGPWEVVLDPRDSLFHTQRPELDDEEQVRFTLEPSWDGPDTEALTWSFPRIAQDGGTLRLNWSTLQIDLEVGVESAQPVIAVDAAEAERYTGEWSLTFAGPPGGEDRPAPPAAPLTIAHAPDGTLRQHIPPELMAGPPAPEPDDEASMTPQERERAEARRALATTPDRFHMIMVPSGEGIFQLGWLEHDVLLDIEPVYFEFEMEGDRAVRLQVRDGNSDRVIGTAVRAESR